MSSQALRAEKAHTATPWKIFRTKTGVYIGVGDKDGQGILDAGFGVWSDGAEREANASFAVLAVNCHDELVAALEDCAEILFHLGTAGKNPSQDEAIDAVRERARIAVANATGIPS